MPQIYGKQIKDGTILDAQIGAGAAIALSKLAEAVIQADGGQAFTGEQSMGTNKLTNLAAPTSANDAVRKVDLDSVSSGVSWKGPVQARHYIGTFTVAGIDALSPNDGDAVVALDAGTPSATGSDLLAIGDIAEYQGAVDGWQKTLANAGGFVPDGTRLIISETSTLESSSSSGDLIDGTDDAKIAVFDGASNTPSSLLVPDNGDGVLCNQGDSLFENSGFTYDDTPPNAWVEFTGLSPVTAGAGMTKSGNTINVGDGGKGVQVNADDLVIDASEITSNATSGLAQSGAGGEEHQLIVKVDSSGGNIEALNVNANGCGIAIANIVSTGLEADGSANIRLATQGNGIAGGNGSTLSVDADSETGGNIQPVNITANGVGLDINAIAGTGIEADGSANLRLATQGTGIAGGNGSTLSFDATAADGNGLSGAGAVLTVDADSETGGDIQPVNITANGVGLDISAIVGNGLEADGSANLNVKGNGTSLLIDGSGVASAVLSQAYKDLTGSVTSADGNKATASTILSAALPKGDCDVQVFVNGVLMNVTDDNTGECFFGQGDTTTARDLSSLVDGDTLRWNGTVAGFELAATDSIYIALETHPAGG